MSLSDQMKLLQSTWAEVLTLSIAFRSLCTPGRIRYAPDLIMEYKLAKDCHCEEVFSKVSYLFTKLVSTGDDKVLL